MPYKLAFWAISLCLVAVVAAAAAFSTVVSSPSEDVGTSDPETVDPSGVVKTVEGVLLPGATVTLYRGTNPEGPFVLVPHGSAVMSPMNRVNPDTTSSSGQFGWDVIAGYYIVRASKLGCVSPDHTQDYVETGIMTIPEPVTDIDLRLDCSMPLVSTQIRTVGGVTDIADDTHGAALAIGGVPIHDVVEVVGSIPNVPPPTGSVVFEYWGYNSVCITIGSSSNSAPVTLAGDPPSADSSAGGLTPTISFGVRSGVSFKAHYTPDAAAQGFGYVAADGLCERLGGTERHDSLIAHVSCGIHTLSVSNIELLNYESSVSSMAVAETCPTAISYPSPPPHDSALITYICDGGPSAVMLLPASWVFGKYFSFPCPSPAGTSASNPTYPTADPPEDATIKACADPDGDCDGVVDASDDCPAVYDPDQENTDAYPLDNGPLAPGDDLTLLMSDTSADACEADDDNDGLSDGDEATGAACGSIVTAATKMDTDGDHLTDGWECSHGSDPTNAASKVLGTGTVDADGDRIQDLWEERGYQGSGATADSDGDGCADLVEVASIDGNKTVGDSDRLSVARRALGIWGPNAAQDYVLDISKNGVVDDPDRIFVARAALLASWVPKSCP